MPEPIKDADHNGFLDMDAAFIQNSLHVAIGIKELVDDCTNPIDVRRVPVGGTIRIGIRIRRDRIIAR